MKRIGFLLTSLSGAGTEKTILTLCTALVNIGQIVDLYIIRSKGDYPEPNGVNCIYLNCTSNKKARKEIRHQLAKLADAYDFFITSNAKYYDSIPVDNKLCSVHITPTAWIKPPKWRFWSYYRILRNLKRKFANKNIIALSQGIKDDLTQHLSCPVSAVTVIPNPFELEKIRQLSLEQNDQSENIGEYIISVASLIKRKRHLDLLHAFANIKNKSIKLLLVGKGPEESVIRETARTLRIEKRVELWGWDPNPYRLLKNAKLSVLMSEAEGLPRALVESLAIGTPVVSTDCPSGPNEVLTGQFRQYLVPVGDRDCLTHAIDQALLHYPEIALLDISRFEASHVARRYLQLFSNQA